MASLKKAYLGMQCFWGESSFAKIEGVMRTRVGYAGGEKAFPTYYDIGDHTGRTKVASVMGIVLLSSGDGREKTVKLLRESCSADDKNYKTIEVQFDSSLVNYETILNWFWSHHDPTQKYKKQYESAVFVIDKEQKQLAESSFAIIQVVLAHQRRVRKEFIKEEYKVRMDLVSK